MKHKVVKALTAIALSLTLAVSTLGGTTQAAQKTPATVNACPHEQFILESETFISAEEANSECHWATYKRIYICKKCGKFLDEENITRYETHTFDSVKDNRSTCSACGYQDEH